MQRNELATLYASCPDKGRNCAPEIRASIAIRKMDCRVKPGNDI